MEKPRQMSRYMERAFAPVFAAFGRLRKGVGLPRRANPLIMAVVFMRRLSPRRGAHQRTAPRNWRPQFAR